MSKTTAWTDEERAEIAAQAERDNATAYEGRVQRPNEAVPNATDRAFGARLNAVQDAYDLGYLRGHHAGVLEATVAQLGAATAPHQGEEQDR